MPVLVLVILCVVALAGVARWMPKTSTYRDGRDEKTVQLPKRGVMISIITTIVLILLIGSITIVPPGTTKIVALFGKVQHQTYGEGPHLIHPFYNTHNMSIKRQVINLSSEQSGDGTESTVQAVSKDNLPIDIDVTYVFRLNPTMAWWVYQNIGTEETYLEQLIKPTARNATRDATVGFSSDEATTSNRDGLAIKMATVFEEHLTFGLQKAGLEQAQAASVFTVMPVILRKALPPKSVLDAIALKAAAKQDLERQTTLTEIAEQIAQRRANEGRGVSNLFAELPKDFSAEEISLVLGALAVKEQADAIMKQVETGQPQTLVLGVQAPVSINAGQQTTPRTPRAAAPVTQEASQ